MKSLTLLRHAKSTWDDPVARDFDRPLNPRGHQAARAVGEAMKEAGLGFELVLASPARRVIETLDEVAETFGPLQPVYEPRLYLASPDTLLEIARAAGDGIGRLMLVGHNPGLESLALRLTGKSPLRSQVELKYPTGTLAGIDLPIGRWRDVADGSGTLVRFIRPRDLDPSLGPDEDS